MYPSERYVSESYDILFSWMGSLSRLCYRLGMMSDGVGTLKDENVTTVTKLGGE